MIRRAIPLPALLATGCTLLTATSPQVEVQRVDLRAISPLEQSLAVNLCVTNPNDSELAFRRIAVAIDVAGAPLADTTTELPVRLPPHSSTLVPLAVTTTARNLAPQLLQLLGTGGLDYRLHGSVQLETLALTLPFSRAGRLDLLATGQQLLSDATPPGATRCTAPGR